MATPPLTAPLRPPSAAPAAAGGEGGVDGNAIGARDDARIIRTGSIDLEVKDVPTALRIARDAIVGLGGYVGASNTSNVDDQPTAQITYRIPTDRWEDALDVLRTLNGQTTKVVTEQTEAVDVTGQVDRHPGADPEPARQRDRAAADRRERGQGQRRPRGRGAPDRGPWSDRAADRPARETSTIGPAYATLTASFSTPVIAVEARQQGLGTATTVDEAAASLISILQGLATAGIWFLIVWVPILLVLGVLVAVGRVAREASRAGTTTRRPGPAASATAPRRTARRIGRLRATVDSAAPRSADRRGTMRRMTDQAERYDRIAEGYAQWWAPVLAPAVERLLDRAEPWVADGAVRVLDIGTGTGQLAFGALARWRDRLGRRCRCLGRAWAAWPTRSRIGRLGSDADAVPDGGRVCGRAAVPGSSRSIVALSSFVFQLVPNRARALREARRVLRPGATLALRVLARRTSARSRRT